MGNSDSNQSLPAAMDAVISPKYDSGERFVVTRLRNCGGGRTDFALLLTLGYRVLYS